MLLYKRELAPQIIPHRRKLLYQRHIKVIFRARMHIHLELRYEDLSVEDL